MISTLRDNCFNYIVVFFQTFLMHKHTLKLFLKTNMGFSSRSFFCKFSTFFSNICCSTNLEYNDKFTRQIMVNNKELTDFIWS